MVYLIPVVVIDGQINVGWDYSTVDFEDDFDDRRPSPEEMEKIKWLAEREERMEAQNV